MIYKIATKSHKAHTNIEIKIGVNFRSVLAFLAFFVHFHIQIYVIIWWEDEKSQKIAIWTRTDAHSYLDCIHILNRVLFILLKLTLKNMKIKNQNKSILKNKTIISKTRKFLNYRVSWHLENFDYFEWRRSLFCFFLFFDVWHSKVLFFCLSIISSLERKSS